MPAELATWEPTNQAYLKEDLSKDGAVPDKHKVGGSYPCSGGLCFPPGAGKAVVEGQEVSEVLPHRVPKRGQLHPASVPEAARKLCSRSLVKAQLPSQQPSCSGTSGTAGHIYIDSLSHCLQ